MRKNHVFVILGVLFGLNLLAWVAVYDLRPQGLAALKEGEPRPALAGWEVVIRVE